MEDSWPAISESDLYDPWVALSDLHEKLSSDQLEFLGPELIFKAVAVGDPEKIDKLSQRLLEQIAQRQKRIQAGETALVRRDRALADSKVNVLVTAMLEACKFYNHSLPGKLIELISVQLGTNTRAHKQSRRPAEQLEAIRILAKNPDAKTREIADALGLSPNTVSLWRRKSDFKRRVNAMRFFEASLAPLQKPSKE